MHRLSPSTAFLRMLQQKMTETPERIHAAEVTDALPLQTKHFPMLFRILNGQTAPDGGEFVTPH
jgi:hypothetical protein